MYGHHTETKPVILLGQGRSGTSVTAQLMREHLGVAFGTESQFIPRYYRRLAQYGDLSIERNLRRLVGHILEERWFTRSRKFNNFQTTLDSIVADVRQPTYRAVLDAIFGQLAKHLGMARYGDKTPAYCRHLDIMAEVYPDARYVHMVRDGRDVALSMLDMYVMPKHVYFAAKEWRSYINEVDRFLETLPDDQAIEIRYEDLLSSPVKTFTRLAAFLRIEDADGKLAASLAHDLPSRLKRDNCHKWRTGLSPRQIKGFEAVACLELVKHGYPTSVRQPEPEPSLPARLAWRARSKLNLWKRREYWREHWYRVGLRCRDSWRAIRAVVTQ